MAGGRFGRGALLGLGLGLALAAGQPRKPNVILVNADDLGYGDLGCYGATKLKTPAIDQLAREGVRFTQACASAATSTPSRYSLLTGEWPFRRDGVQVLPGDASLLLTPGRTSLATVFKAAGYATGIVGKWHLGLGNGPIDWNGEIAPGPREVGFDSSFIMAATGDRVPCVFLENQRVAGLDPKDPISVDYHTPFPGEPTGRDPKATFTMASSHGHNQALINGIGRIGYMQGGKAARWKDEALGDTFLAKALDFIRGHKDAPFFLYYAAHEPHVPRVPAPRFRGVTGLGPRGDVIAQFDASIGALMAELDRLGLAQDTLVVLTSDNGPVLDDGYRDNAVGLNDGHRPAGPFRGGKYSAFEGGTRVPLVLRWKGRVAPKVSQALVSQVDFLASFARLVGTPIPQGEARDSEDHLAALLGKDGKGRRSILTSARRTSLREGAWKLIPGGDGAAFDGWTSTELGNAPEDQLYDLTRDPGEKADQAAHEPRRVKALKERLAKTVAGKGRAKQ